MTPTPAVPNHIALSRGAVWRVPRYSAPARPSLNVRQRWLAVLTTHVPKAGLRGPRGLWNFWNLGEPPWEDRLLDAKDEQPREAIHHVEPTVDYLQAGGRLEE